MSAPPVPFRWESMKPSDDEERSANYEAARVAYARSLADPTDAGDTRSAILNLMGAWSSDVMGKSEVMELLNRHEANLRCAWEHAELGFAKQRAEDAIRGAVRAAMQGKML